MDVNIALLTVTDTRTFDNDKSGAILVEKIKEAKHQFEIINKILQMLDANSILKIDEFASNEIDFVNSLNLISLKPTMYICNVDEESIHTGNELSKKVIEFAKNNNHSVVLISASIEAQIAELDNEEEKLEFLKELNLDQTTLNKVIKSGYELLGLINYFTCGPKETRSWTIKRETLAPQAAGKIHTDFEKGFIRAQTISYQNLIDSGSISNAKTKGLLRSEGKEYVVNEGDVMEFLFNV